jgi:hypothetical protein
VLCVLTIGLLISTTYSVSYGSSSVTLEKDIVIDSPVVSIFDLPNEVTFKIYDSNTAAIPITFQTFLRGEYSAYYNIAMSDGFTQKSVVKFKVEFTNLSQSGIYVDALKGTENFWIEVELDRKLAGEREPLDKEITNQILLAITAQNTGGSDTSNLQNANQDSSPQSASSTYQSASESRKGVDGYSQKGSSNVIVQNVAGSNGQIQFNNGGVQAGASQFYYDETLKTVGIGTSSPVFPFEIKAGTTQAFLQPVYNTEVRFGSNAHPFAIYSGGSERVKIDLSGNVGIGTSSPCPDCKLAVNGKIRAKQVVVDTGWSDFVFDNNYKLMPLQELERFIRENRHLPDIPTEADVKENGISVGDISAKLLQKIEELTLYVIELKKENEAVRSELSVLQKQLPYSWSCLGVTCHSMP